MTGIPQRIVNWRQLGVVLSAKDGMLKVDGPRKILTPELVTDLKSVKQEVLEYLEAHPGFPQAADLEKANAPIKLESRDGPLTLSFAQERMWFLHELEDLGALFNIPVAIRLNGELRPELLEIALQQVVQRHEVLRSRIYSDQEFGPQQQIDEKLLVMNTVDLTGSEEHTRKALRDLTSSEAGTEFRLSDVLKIRATLAQVNDYQGQPSYILLLTLHHVASDGWSVSILTEELSALYNEALRGEHTSALAPLPLQYADFASWQREWLDDNQIGNHVLYWKEQLKDAPALLELPTDYQRPAKQEFNGKSLDIVLPTQLVSDLKNLGGNHGATLFITLLAAFQLLLSRYSGQSDVVVGSPIAGRQQQSFEKMIGLFVNTLVLRTQIDASDTFIELLKQVKKTAFSAYEHQEVPFEKLVEELKPTRSLSYSPIFQVMFILQNVPSTPLAFDGLSSELLQSKYENAKFDLLLEVTESTDEMVAVFNYNTDLFKTDTIQRMAGHFRTLLQGIASNPHQALLKLPLLTSQEMEVQQGRFNRTNVDYPLDDTVCDLFLAHADKTPNAIAVTGPYGRSLTYAELDKASDSLANSLLSGDAASSNRIGIYLERDTHMLVALLAVLKCGRAYVPLDPMFPPERLQLMAEDAGLTVIITERSLLDSMPGTDTTATLVDAPDVVTHIKSTNRIQRAVSTDTAYVIYTSGSTGRPKGVSVSHRALTNLLCSMRREPGFDSKDRLLAITTLSFDIAMLELFLPLICGGTTVVASREETLDPQQLSKLLKTSGATLMQATPATWRMLLDSGWTGIPGLKIISGGEALPRELANDLLQQCDELWNYYGPTETTIWSTGCRVLLSDGPVSIGKPIANTQIYILNELLEPQPIGVRGELYIAGDGIADGYLHLPELTAERFVPDTITGATDRKIYRTGDAALWHTDGSLELLGRLDEQVKLRGFRLEPGEIRERLVEVSGIADAVVILREDISGEPRLVAYMVPTADGIPNSADLRAALNKTLPEYMVPSAWVELPALPLTPNGKINRRALPAPIQEKSVTSDIAAPLSESEDAMAAVWSSILGVEKVGRNEAFFNLGGHSLMAIKLVTEMKNQLGVKIPLQRLFQGATIADLVTTENTSPGSITGANFNTEYDNSICRLIHGEHGGDTLFMAGSNPAYKFAAGYLPDTCTVYQLDAYTIQANRKKSGLRSLKTINAIAEVCVEQIKILQPQGPYKVCGGCEGAHIAYEIANQLVECGNEVDFVITLHNPAPGAATKEFLGGNSLRRLWWQIQAVTSKGSLRELGIDAYRELIGHELITHSLFSAMFRYRPTACLDITMRHVKLEDAPNTKDPLYGWGDRFGRPIIVDYLPGTHDTWLKAHIEEFGEYLRYVMNEQTTEEQYLETGT